ncbi:MAG: hypothetical protein ACRD5M_11155 [Candidatus Acidiferrales bacterium]
MKKNVGFLLMIGMTTLSLSGCWPHRVWGPCYGVGCPAFTASNAPKVAQTSQAPAANVQAQKPAAAEPESAGASQASPAPAATTQSNSEQAKPGRFTRMLSALHLHSKS